MSNRNRTAAGESCQVKDMGGQAVMEGVMMRSGNCTAVTVRRPDGTMVTKRSPFTAPKDKHPWMGKPFIRGVVNMATMLYFGMNTLEDSTRMLGMLDEEPTKFEKWLAEKLGKSVDKIVMGVAIVLAVILSIGLFMAIPAGVESVLRAAGMKPLGYTLLGGLVKILILMGYMIAVGFVPDVRRTFQYHGAEHKSVHCFESKLGLTPENAQTFSRLHPRCGTAFLLIVFSISILLFLALNILVPISNYFLRLLFHLAMLPIVAGVSYEVLMGLAHSNSGIARILRWPGLQMQRLTTREPDASMLECAIVSVNVVLYGLPEHAEKTPEGWAILHDYRESEKGYVPPVQEMESEAETAGDASPAKETESDEPAAEASSEADMASSGEKEEIPA
ncbi:MAG: DUF1385 domain-containing protein [Clostridiales bacterium]|nr:DUF1385 domain-containing protein [Clostridiales bacterium]